MPGGPGFPGTHSTQSQGTFSTLNNDVIPDRDFLTTIEDYQPKVSLELIERLMQQIGMQSTD